MKRETKINNISDAVEFLREKVLSLYSDTFFEFEDGNDTRIKEGYPLVFRHKLMRIINENISDEINRSKLATALQKSLAKWRCDGLNQEINYLSFITFCIRESVRKDVIRIRSGRHFCAIPFEKCKLKIDGNSHELIKDIDDFVFDASMISITTSGESFSTSLIGKDRKFFTENYRGWEEKTPLVYNKRNGWYYVCTLRYNPFHNENRLFTLDFVPFIPSKNVSNPYDENVLVISWEISGELLYNPNQNVLELHLDSKTKNAYSDYCPFKHQRDKELLTSWIENN